MNTASKYYVTYCLFQYRFCRLEEETSRSQIDFPEAPAMISLQMPRRGDGEEQEQEQERRVVFATSIFFGDATCSGGPMCSTGQSDIIILYFNCKLERRSKKIKGREECPAQFPPVNLSQLVGIGRRNWASEWRAYQRRILAITFMRTEDVNGSMGELESKLAVVEEVDLAIYGHCARSSPAIRPVRRALWGGPKHFWRDGLDRIEALTARQAARMYWAAGKITDEARIRRFNGQRGSYART
ncbi:hypothetical protein CPC08DRAFT_801637 [Agrocybe pediades]|nr:hypothetical protein CPC08DRAFT_801637 [Agrocybe pediades]